MRDSRKCVHQKKGAKTFWTATWLAPKGKTLRRRLRHSQRHIAKLRSDKVQQSAKREIKRRYRVVQSFPLEGIDAAPVASESHGGRGAVVLATYSPGASAAVDFAEAPDRRVPVHERRRYRVHARPGACLRLAILSAASAATARTKLPSSP